MEDVYPGTLVGDEAFKDMIDKGVIRVNDYQRDGMTFLHRAVLSHNRKHVKLLLENKADANIKCLNNFATPLHYAMGHSHVKITRLLLDNKANPLLETLAGTNPLETAIMIGQASAYLCLDSALSYCDLSRVDFDRLLYRCIEYVKPICAQYPIYMGAKKPQGFMTNEITALFEKKEERKKECIQAHIVLKSMGFIPDLRRLLVSTLWGTRIFN